MTNKRVLIAFRDWARQRPGGIHGFIATLCLTAAALLALSRTLGRHAQSHEQARGVRIELLRRHEGEARSLADAGWRAEVTRKLEEILARIPDGASILDSSSE